MKFRTQLWQTILAFRGLPDFLAWRIEAFTLRVLDGRVLSPDVCDAWWWR